MDWWTPSTVDPPWVLPAEYALAAAAFRLLLVPGPPPRAIIVLLEVDARAPSGPSA